MTALAPSLTAFLREHLPRERNASRHTVAAYASTFGLLLRYAAERLDRRPTDLTIEDLDPDLILSFLSVDVTVLEVPRLRLEAPLAVVRAAADEKRHPDAKTVCDVTILNSSIIHNLLFLFIQETDAACCCQ